MSHDERGSYGRLVSSSAPLMSKREINRRYYENGGKARRDARRATERGRAVLRDGHLRRQYGMTQEAYDVLLERQGGCCALCRAERGHNGTRLAVDHCHSTGRIRGLLCTKCNTALGHLGDSAAGLRLALAYIERA